VSDANLDNAGTPPRPDFPYGTVLVTLLTLFLFLGLMWFAAQSSSPLAAPPAADTKAEPKVDPTTKLEEIKARNQGALEGVGAKMPLREAHGKLIGSLKGPNDTLPFPTPEPPVAAAPAPKADEKKDDKGGAAESKKGG
jgi:hypothetical protein